MRIRVQTERDGWLVRVFGRDGEIAWMTVGLGGLCAEISFPSDWHEQRRAWVRLGFGLFRVAFSFPWHRVVPDEMQCSGPTYGFVFFGDGLHLHWGKTTGRRSDPMVVIAMPWAWRHREHKILSEPEQHPYRYTLKSGEVQNRMATIKVETRLWTRPWIPWRRFTRYIDVTFSDEVGERTGSWKGGCLGCGYDMRPGESPVATLRRMEHERLFL